MTVDAALSAYLDAESPQTLAELHAAIKATPYFNRRTPWYPRAVELLDQQRHDEVIRLLSNEQPGILFCPDAHAMLSYAYAQIDDDAQARAHAFYAQLALRAILASGQGTEQQPWLVLHVADQYALLRHLGLESHRQEAIERAGQPLDVHAETTAEPVEASFGSIERAGQPLDAHAETTAEPVEASFGSIQLLDVHTLADQTQRWFALV